MGGIGISCLENGGGEEREGGEMMMISYVMYIFVSLFFSLFFFGFLYIDVTLMW